MKKKLIAIVCAAVILVGAVAGWYFLRRSGTEADGSEIYVEPVSTIMGYAGVMPGSSNPFSGVVESQETVGVNFDSSKTLLECLVTEGDEVKAGDPLFQYDMSEQNMQLEQLKLELQKINNNIDDLNAQISSLQKDKDSAPSDEQLSYATQIQSLQSNVKQEKYNKQVKELEITRAEGTLENSSVKAPIDGVIYKINSNNTNENGGDMYSSGNDSAYITIMALGNYRIKGYINEQNMGVLHEGDEVTIRSRVDQSLTWTGVVSVIDKSNPESGNSQNGGIYYDGGSSSSDDVTTSSKYPFYVSLTSYDGLMLGQHVYIESGTVSEDGEDDDTISLSSGYIVFDEDNSAFVWADKDGKIEKHYIIVGEYDIETDTYPVQDGLTLDTLIAWPDDTIEEGKKTMKVEVNYSEDGMADGANDEEIPYEGGDAGNVIAGGDAE